MSKNVKVVVSIFVAILFVGGSVAAIGANTNHQMTVAKSASSHTRKTSEKKTITAKHSAAKLDTKQFTAGVSSKVATSKVTVKPATTQVATASSNVTQSAVTTKAIVAKPTTITNVPVATVSTPADEQAQQQAVANTQLNAASEQVTETKTGAASDKAVATTTNTDPELAVAPEDDAQGQATTAAVNYAKENGVPLKKGLQIGTMPSESGSGYDVIVRNKHLAEIGQGNGIINSYHVDKQGVVTAN